jgi:hypothetical protein
MSHETYVSGLLRIHTLASALAHRATATSDTSEAHALLSDSLNGDAGTAGRIRGGADRCLVCHRLNGACNSGCHL